MKIRSIAFMFLIAISSFQCRNNPDYKPISEDDFNNKINRLETYCPKSAYSDDFMVLSAYFYIITGRKPSSDLKTYSDFFSVPDTIFYTFSDFKKDKRYWKRWFSKNHLIVPQTLSDSIFDRLY